MTLALGEVNDPGCKCADSGWQFMPVACKPAEISNRWGSPCNQHSIESVGILSTLRWIAPAKTIIGGRLL